MISNWNYFRYHYIPNTYRGWKRRSNLVITYRQLKRRLG